MDGLEGAVAEAGDLLLASREGHLGPLPGAIHGDLATLLTEGRTGTGSGAEITLFKSVGTAIADLGALAAAAGPAFELGLGIALE